MQLQGEHPSGETAWVCLNRLLCCNQQQPFEQGPQALHKARKAFPKQGGSYQDFVATGCHSL